MKKIAPRKLSLSRATIRELHATETRRAAGGKWYTAYTCDPCSSEATLAGESQRATRCFTCPSYLDYGC